MRLIVLVACILLAPSGVAAADWLNVDADMVVRPDMTRATDHAYRLDEADGNPRSPTNCVDDAREWASHQRGFEFWEQQGTTSCIAVRLNVDVPNHATVAHVEFGITRQFVAQGKWEVPAFQQEIGAYQSGELIDRHALFGTAAEPSAQVWTQHRFDVTPGDLTLEWWFADLGAGALIVGDVQLPVGGYSYSSDVLQPSIIFEDLNVTVESSPGIQLSGSVVAAGQGGRTLVLPELPANAEPRITLTFPAMHALVGGTRPDGQPMKTDAWSPTTANGITTVVLDANLLDESGEYQLNFDVGAIYTPSPVLAALVASFGLLFVGASAAAGREYHRTASTLIQGKSSMRRYVTATFVGLAAMLAGLIVWLSARNAWGHFGKGPVSAEVLVAGACITIAIFALLLTRQILRTSEVSVLHQKELERSNRDLAQFSHIVSHDLRAPLRSISAFTGLLDRQYGKGLEPTAREYLGLAQSGAVRMSNLLDALGAYSRLNDGAPAYRSVALKSIVEEVRNDLHADLVAAGGRVVSGKLPTVQCDPALMRDALLNLVQNAIKFRHPDRKPYIRIRAETGPAGVLLTVRDNGLGMSESVVHNIFEPFQRAHGSTGIEGTGMGLAICRRIVEHHGGRIDVDSKEGQGTTFILYLPNA